MSFQASAKRPTEPSSRNPLGSLTSSVSVSRPATASDISCFHVVADAHPGMLGRLLAVIAKRGFVPSYVHSVLGGRRGDELAVDLQVASLDEAARDLVSAQLRAIVSVRAVLTSVKTFAD